MSRIDKSDWYPLTFSEVTKFADVLRLPDARYPGYDIKEQDKLRQYQVSEGEVLRILGEMNGFSLVMRFDQSLGWLSSPDLKPRPDIRCHQLPQFPKISPQEFFSKWEGVPYVWGGTTECGIDCSGFSQLYFLQIQGIVIPKNSHDQKKLGVEIPMTALEDHDLIFCFRKDKVGTHHVVIFFQGNCWHARRSKGVVRQSLAEFESEFNIVGVRRLEINKLPGLTMMDIK